MKYKIFAIIIIIIFSIGLAPKEFQNDTFFTIAIGEEVLKGEVGDVNSLVWHENLEFVHSGYFDCIVTFLYNNFDFLGIYIFVMILEVICGLLIFYIISKKTNNIVFSFFSTLVIIYKMQEIFCARAQIFSIIFIIFEYYLLDELYKNGEKINIIILVIISYIWANLHASVYPMYLVLYIPFIVEEIFSRFIKKHDYTKIAIEKSKNIKLIISCLIISIIVGLCTPTGIEPYTDMFRAMNGISSEIIQELRPLNLIEAPYFIFLISSIFAILCFSCVKIKLSDCFFLLGLGILSLSTIRSLFYFYSIGSIIVFSLISNFLEIYGIYEIKISNKIKYFGLIAILICIILYSLSEFVKKISQEYVVTNGYPIDVAEYILDNVDIKNMKLYNHFNFGSYLEYRGIPVFIDSRSGMYTEEFNPGCTILKDFANITGGKVSYKEIFDKYNITHALLYTTELINMYICDDNNWKPIYEGDNFILYEKIRSN